MAWIEEEIEHAKFLDTFWWKILRRFRDENGNYWWQDFNEHVEKVELYRISFERGLLVKRNNRFYPSNSTKEGNVCVTRHIIMRRWDNEFLGLAQSTGSIRVNVEDLPRSQTELMRWFINLYRDAVDYTTIYAYMLDTYEGYTHYLDEEGNPTPVIIFNHDYGMGVLRASLDVEFYHEDQYYKRTMQSPIMTMRLKEETEQFQSIGKLNYKTNTNWWDDSIIRVRGNITEQGMFLIFQADSAPMWQNNVVTSVPFYFGDIINQRTNTKTVCMFGGTQVPYDFDFDSVEETTDVLQPITRDYVYYPSNGVDSVMVKRTKYGARYQAHYLRWNAPPNAMPPTRHEDKGDGVDRKYPRAWNYLRQGYYNYDFHPSRYSEKMHVSRAYVVHPEDGVVGYIPDIVMTPLINLSEGEILQLPYYCVDCEEEPIYPIPAEPDSSGWKFPALPEICKDEFIPATSVKDAEEFAIECLGATPVNYQISLEWANYFNEGMWRLFKQYPSIKSLVAENNVELVLDPNPPNPNVLGYFTPPTPTRPMRIALIANKSLEDYKLLIKLNYDVGFLATPDIFHLVNHEMGHYCHYNTVDLSYWNTITQIDPDGYGDATPLSTEDQEYIETHLSEYACTWFPIELVAEAFAVFTLGYGVDEKIMDWYGQYRGYIPKELTKEQIVTNPNKP